MSILADNLHDNRARAKKMRATARRTAKIIAEIEAKPELFIIANSKDLLEQSLKALFTEIAELEKAIVLEESRNSTTRGEASTPNGKTRKAPGR